jgi:hypothetical protein
MRRGDGATRNYFFASAAWPNKPAFATANANTARWCKIFWKPCALLIERKPETDRRPMTGIAQHKRARPSTFKIARCETGEPWRAD